MPEGLTLAAPQGGRWKAGWYRLSARHAPGAGAHGQSRLVAWTDAARTRSYEVPVARPQADGRIASVVVLFEDAVALEWQGWSADALSDVALAPVGRNEASRQMLRDLRAPGGVRSWSVRPRMLLAMLGAGLLGGPARAGERLVSGYFAGCRETAPPQPHVTAQVHTRGAQPGHDALVAFDQLQAVPAAEGWHWRAPDIDPKFLLVRDGQPLALGAGWYSLRIEMAALEGRVIGPCLYPAYESCTQDGAIPLPELDADGRIEALVLLPRPARHLRFDPTSRAASFHVSRFELTQLGRVSALAWMLRGGAQGRLSWRALLDFLRAATRRGLPKAASDLYRRHLQDVQNANGDYEHWVRHYDTLDSLDLDRLRAQCQALPATPLISIVVPVYDPPIAWLRRCLDSVIAQVYPHWELCIAEDASPSPQVREVLREYAARDRRIKVEFRASNGHISAASNTALALASGEYVGLLDHDDELPPHALLEVVRVLAADPALELVYSDEDKIDEHGRRFHPNFKPDWNPDLLLSQNYVCHFSVIRTARVRAAGGFRTGFEGSQDHDLILRCTAGLDPQRVAHIPRVLYHWRAIAGSTALERDAKDYAAEAGRRAVADHLQRDGSGAHVSELSHGHYRVHWPLPTPAPRVSIIVPTRDKVELLRMCVESVFAKTRYPDFEMIVVDNQSAEPAALAYLDSLQSRRGVRVLRYDAPFNYAAINNAAARACSGQVLVLLNNDIEVIHDGWLEELVGHALRPEIGAVGAMLYYPNGTIQHAGVILGVGGVANHAYVGQPAGYPGHGARGLVAQNLSAVTGACLAVRRSVYEQVGGLDERLRVAFNDIDFCLRLLEQGYRNVWTPFAELIHHESASRGRDDSEEKATRFLGEVRFMEERWGPLLRDDPAYNVNLSLEGGGFELATPPRSRGMARVDSSPLTTLSTLQGFTP